MISTLDNLPKWGKLLLALPVLDIVWVVYRLVRSIEKKNALGIILAAVLIVVGIPFMWLIDFITLLLQDRIYWID